MAFKILALSPCIFLVTTVTFLLKLILAYTQVFPCDDFFPEDNP